MHNGHPKREIGTISTVDGRFEIEVPADTLEFHHVSYLIGLYPVSGSKPIYVNVAMSETQQNFCIKPDEFILLEPGKYFIAFQIVSTDEEAVRKYEETPEAERERYAMHLYTPLYFKSSYIRHEALGKMEHLPVNIGITVKGLEYQ